MQIQFTSDSAAHPWISAQNIELLTPSAESSHVRTAQQTMEKITVGKLIYHDESNGQNAGRCVYK